MQSQTRQAIARIDVLNGDDSVSRGTGFLVTDDLVLTALHVVADRKQDPPAPHPGRIRLQFPNQETSAAIVDDLYDRHSDWVLLRCADKPAVSPVVLSGLTQSHQEWTTFGFPDANPRDGMTQAGRVRNHNARLDQTHAYQLFSHEAAAGSGAPVKGLSGAPVFVGGRVVGLLRFALMKDNRTVAGTLYACPIASLSQRCPFLSITSCVGRAVPERRVTELPDLVDRGEQTAPIRRLVAGGIPDHSRPVLVVFYGDNQQGHLRLIKRIEKRLLRPAVEAASGSPVPLMRHDVKWPMGKPENFDSNLSLNIAELLVGVDPKQLGELGTMEAINKRIHRDRVPLMLVTQLHDDRWRRFGKDGLQRFFHYWDRWPPLTIGQQLFVFLSIQYRQTAPTGGFFSRLLSGFGGADDSDPRSLIEQQIAETTRDLTNPNLLMPPDLPELDSIPVSAAEEWASEPEIAGRWNSTDLIDAIRRMFDDWESERETSRIPMNELTKRLRELLESDAHRLSP